MRGELKPGYKQTEVGVIPEDWEVTTVGNEFSIQLGKMLDSEKNVGVPKPYLGNRAVQWGRIDLSDLGAIKMTPSDLQRFRLRQGDLLVCEGGEIGRAAIWNEPIEECYYQKALHRLRPIRGYNMQLMLNVLRRLASTGFLNNFVTQTSIAHLPKDKLETVPIPLPPTKAEQEVIAEALSDADALIESLEQLIAKKRQIKQGAMQELLTGKKRLPGFATKSGYKQTEVGAIPEDWNVTTVGEISDIKIGPFGSALHERDYVNNGTPIITVEHLGESEVHHTNLPMVSDADKLRLKAYSLRQGDIVFSRVGSVDRNALIKVAEDGWLFSGRLLRVRLKGRNTDAPYLSYHFHSEAFKQRVKDVAVGQTMASINTQILMGVKIILPPTKAEQTAIATILTDMDAEIAALEEKLTKAHQLKQGMMQELLTGKTRLVESKK
jgi:type I restriction enzyme S subunit